MQFDGKDINVAGKQGKDFILHDVYSAVNDGTKVPWTRTLPSVDGKWTVNSFFFFGVGDHPCLFWKAVRFFTFVFLENNAAIDIALKC